MALIDTTRTVQPHDPAPTGGGRRVSTIADLMARLASWRVWVASAIVFGPFAGALFGSNAPFAVPRVEAACGQAPPDTRFTSSAADVNGFLEACGVVGREAYRALQVADLLYPLVFGLFLAATLALVLVHVAPGRRSLLALAALPLVGAGFDYLENVFAWLALAAFPDPAATDVLLGPASAAKTVTFWAAGTLLLVALGVLAVVVVRRWVRRLTGGVGVDDDTGEARR